MCYSQTVDLKFSELQNNGSDYKIKVLMKGSTVFKLGTSNITFNFNNNALSLPVLDSAYGFSGGLYNTLTITNPLEGVCSINIELFVINSGMPVDTVWTEIASIKFHIDNLSGYTQLAFRTNPPNRTNIWKDDNASMLDAGIFYPMNNLLPVEEEKIILNNFSVENNYPNPFNSRSTISYTIPQSGTVSLDIYDITGRFICNLTNEEQSAGRHTVVFDASNLAGGIYFYKLTTSNKSITGKMIYLK